MLSLGIEASLAFCTARPSAALPTMSPPPSFAAVVIARASFVKSLPRRESTIAFLCLIDAHLECPDIGRIVEASPRVGSGRLLAGSPRAYSRRCTRDGGIAQMSTPDGSPIRDLDISLGARRVPDRSTFERLARRDDVPGQLAALEVKLLILGVDTSAPQLY